MQAPASYSYCLCIDFFQIGSLHPLGIQLRDLCVMCSPWLQFMLMIPSIVKVRGVVREYMKATCCTK